MSIAIMSLTLSPSTPYYQTDTKRLKRESSYLMTYFSWKSSSSWPFLSWTRLISWRSIFITCLRSGLSNQRYIFFKIKVPVRCKVYRMYMQKQKKIDGFLGGQIRICLKFILNLDCDMTGLHSSLLTLMYLFCGVVTLFSYFWIVRYIFHLGNTLKKSVKIHRNITSEGLLWGKAVEVVGDYMYLQVAQLLRLLGTICTCRWHSC